MMPGWFMFLILTTLGLMHFLASYTSGKKDETQTTVFYLLASVFWFWMAASIAIHYRVFA